MAEDKQDRWLLTKSNLIVGVISVLMIVIISFVITQRQGLIREHDQLVTQVTSWQHKLDRLKVKNQRVIYLPKPGDINLSTSQAKSVQWLSAFFTQITTFSNPTAYATNYRYAKRSIADKQFFDTFMTAPVDQSGTSTVVATNLKFKNVRTQVIVTGNDTYQVVVTYIPYHALSDLYQESTLTTLTQIFNVKGTVGHYSQVRLASDMVPNGVVVKAGSIE